MQSNGDRLAGSDDVALDFRGVRGCACQPANVEVEL